MRTDGEFVGLPEGQMGNSEVGHLNLGAGRIVYQELERISMAAKTERCSIQRSFKWRIATRCFSGKICIFIGLVSDGGVHSHIDHLDCIMRYRFSKGVDKINYSARIYRRSRLAIRKRCRIYKKLQQHLKTSGGRIASICGRYYSMDRDKRWSVSNWIRCNGEWHRKNHRSGKKRWKKVMLKNVTDEFIKPIVCVNADQSPAATIGENDVVICFNFRTDRCRQITTVLTQQDMPEAGMHTLPLDYITMTRYDHNFKNVNVILKMKTTKTLGEIMELHGLKQIRIAETEKYPHVTFFLQWRKGKRIHRRKTHHDRIPKVATYDLQPEMSAFPVKMRSLPN